MTIIHADPSIIWIFILTLSFYFAKNDRIILAGLILSLMMLNPYFYIILFIILLFSFRPKIFIGFLCGSLFIILFSGIIDKFFLWNEWLKFVKYIVSDFIKSDLFFQSVEYSKRTFFYPLLPNNNVMLYLEHIFIFAGRLTLFFPVYYSFKHKMHFSRNSYWFILAMTLVLANPFLYDFELVILILPTIIFFNLLVADRIKIDFALIMLAALIVAITSCFIIAIYIHIQLFTILLWFFLVNAALGKRIRNYTKKTYIGYWTNY